MVDQMPNVETKPEVFHFHLKFTVEDQGKLETAIDHIRDMMRGHWGDEDFAEFDKAVQSTRGKIKQLMWFRSSLADCGYCIEWWGLGLDCDVEV